VITRLFDALCLIALLAPSGSCGQPDCSFVEDDPMDETGLYPIVPGDYVVIVAPDDAWVGARVRLEQTTLSIEYAKGGVDYRIVYERGEELDDWAARRRLEPAP
jgi:hypothetical protein